MASKGFLWMYTIAAIGTILIWARSEATDPCKTYKEIRDDYRDISNGNGMNCDKSLEVGWYRFFIENVSATIPTKCIKPGVCSSQLSMYVNLKGKPMPAEGETLSAWACASYSILEHWSCCALQQPIRIKHCPGNFYVYHLKPTDRCPVSYCAIKDPTHLETRLTVRHGYHIRYIETTKVDTTTQPIETTQSVEETTVQDIEETTMLIQTTEVTQVDEILKAETTQKDEITTSVSVEDKEEKLLGIILSSGDDTNDHDTTHISYQLSTSSEQDKQKATTIQSVVLPATTTRSVPRTSKNRTHQYNQKPAELIFLLNGHDKEEVLASFRANFTAAMQRANRNIHNITVKELCPIGDAVKILFWAYDNEGNLIPGLKVEENMEMRKKVEEALGLQPLPQRQDIFQEYLALFIILIIIGFLCLIILLSSCMYLYCRRHSGHWDRALAEQMGLFDVPLLSFSPLQYHVTVVPRREARIADSPFSDEAIMSDEILEKSHSSLGGHYPGVGNLNDLSYPNSLSGIKAMNNKNTFNTYPNSYGSLPKDGIEGLVVPIDQLKPEKDTLIIEDTVL